MDFDKLDHTTKQIKRELLSLKKTLEIDNSPTLIANYTQISYSLCDIEF